MEVVDSSKYTVESSNCDHNGIRYQQREDSMNKSALVVEDDVDIVKLMELELGDLGFAVEHAADGEEGVRKATEKTFDLIILDIMLPKLEGIEVCKKIRMHDQHVPIVMVTARTDDTSKVLLLEIGADDYITKPFNTFELKARVKALFRRIELSRTIDGDEKILEYKELRIDFEKRKVSIKGELIDLTPREYDLLALMASRPGRPFSKQQINAEVLGYHSEGYERGISSHINRLRGKIEPDMENPQYIITVRGVGYAFADIDEK